MALQPVSLPPTVLAGATAVQPRRDVAAPLDGTTGAQTPRSIISEQAVVIQFGAQAMFLARSTQPATGDAANADGSPLDALDTREASADLFDAGAANAARNPLASPTRDLLANAFGPDQTDAALIGTLDSAAQQARLRTPGALESDADLFQSPAGPLESGFFRSAGTAGAQSLPERQTLENGLESTFPRAPGSQTLDSAFPLPTTNRAQSGFFRTANAAREPELLATESLQTAFPQVPANDADAGLFRAPGAERTSTDLFAAPGTDEANDLFRAPGTDEANDLFRAPGTDEANDLFPALGTDREDDGLFATPRTDEDVTGLTASGLDRARADEGPGTDDELTLDQQREVQALAQDERELRANAQAQRSAAGGYANGVTSRYEVGPDGRRYLVESDVSLDVSPVAGDPAATLRKMELIERAANLGTPSVSDRAASAEAAQLARQARAQLAAERYAEAQEY